MRTSSAGSVRRRAARSAAIALASLTLLALAACTPTPAATTPAPTPGTTAEKGPDGFEKYFSQKVRWKDCAGFQCAKVKAPLDWGDASSDPITLAVIRKPADGDSSGVLFVNPGGPGGSGVDFVANGWTPPSLGESLDVVGWDPRGVGNSSRVKCGDDKQKDQFLYGTYDVPYDTPEWVTELTDRSAHFADACLKDTGELLGHVDTASTARDLDLLRAVIGGGKLGYLGFSYGTEIGAMYAELFPDHVGRMVLDGAVDPALPASEWLPVQYTGWDSALRAYLGWCLGQRTCPFSGTVDDVMSQIDELIGSVDGAGLTSTDGRTLDSATLATAVTMALYSEDTWPVLSDAFDGVQHGDAGTAFELADAYYERYPDGTYASNTYEVYTAVTCVDGGFAADQETPLQAIEDIEKIAPTLGRYTAYDDYAVLDVACGDWPVPPAERPTEFDAAGAPPILVIGKSNDPATPYVWAQSLADQLESGQLVTVQGEGHTSYGQGNTCVDTTVDDYLLKGTVPAADPMC